MGCCEQNLKDYCWCIPLVLAGRKGHGDTVKMLLGREQVSHGKPDSGSWKLLSHPAQEKDMGEWRKYLGGKRSNSTSQITAAKYYSVIPLRVDMRKWWKCSLSDRRSAPTSHIITAEHHCLILLSKGNMGAAKILFGRDDDNPQKLANDGRSPLKWAAGLCHQEMQVLS